MTSDTKTHTDFSIIIPTFNRKFIVDKAIDSAINFIDESLEKYEIIVVDDCSTDGSLEYLKEKYANEINGNIIKIISLNLNSGVVAARNEGVIASRGNWLIFLDSDNELIKRGREDLESNVLESSFDCVLFRCVDENDRLIGPKSVNASVSLKYELNNAGCELFGVYRKSSYASEFFKSDVVALRRFESIAYYRLLKSGARFIVSNTSLRKYYFNVPDRLSSKGGVVKDANLMMIGHFILLKDFHKFMNFSTILKKIVAILFYFIKSSINNIRNKLQIN